MLKQRNETEILNAIEIAEALWDEINLEIEQLRAEGVEEPDTSELKDTRDYINDLHHELKRVRA